MMIKRRLQEFCFLDFCRLCRALLCLDSHQCRKGPNIRWILWKRRELHMKWRLEVLVSLLLRLMCFEGKLGSKFHLQPSLFLLQLAVQSLSLALQGQRWKYFVDSKVAEVLNEKVFTRILLRWCILIALVHRVRLHILVLHILVLIHRVWL